MPRILLDTHVHLYPAHDFARTFDSFRRRAARAGAGLGAMFLAEREGQDEFGRLAAGGAALPRGVVAVRRENAALLLRSESGGPPVALVAGRQVACAERVEILALGTRETVPDGIPAAEAVERARRADALPVLAWGAGKWLFGRARVVDSLLRRFPSEELLLGDTSLRPWFWPTPAPMAVAATLGRRVLHGSDPLPPAFEQTRAGQWADLADEPFDLSGPLLGPLLAVLREAPLSPAGRRAGVVQFLRRMLASRKRAAPVQPPAPHDA